MFSHPSLNKKLILPKILKNQKNGKLPKKILLPIGASSLVEPAFNAWCALVHYARFTEEIFLNGASFYRTYDQQLSLNTYRLVYEATPSSGDPVFFDTATPGFSSHGWGLSVDVGLMTEKFPSVENTILLDNTESDEWQWLADNLEKFGFGFEYDDQPWHIVYKAGDTTPSRVKFFINSVKWSVTNFKKGLFAKYAFMSNKPQISLTAPGKSDRIKYLQSVLLHGKTYAAGNIQITGNFDLNLESAVKRLQEDYGIDSTGIVDNDTWNAVDFEAIGMVGSKVWPVKKFFVIRNEPVSVQIPLVATTPKETPENWEVVEWVDITGIESSVFIDSASDMFNASRIIRDHPNMWATKEKVWGVRHGYKVSTRDISRPGALYARLTSGFAGTRYAIAKQSSDLYATAFFVPALLNFLYVSMECGWIWDTFAAGVYSQTVENKPNFNNSQQWFNFFKQYGTPHPAGMAIDFMRLGHADKGGAFAWSLVNESLNNQYSELVRNLNSFAEAAPLAMRPEASCAPFAYGMFAKDHRPTHMHLDVSKVVFGTGYTRVGKLLPELKIPYNP